MKKSYDSIPKLFLFPSQFQNVSETPNKILYSSISSKIFKVQNLAGLE